MNITTEVTAARLIDRYGKWKFPTKTGEDKTAAHEARIDAKYDFAVTLSNGSLLAAIGALALGVLRILSPFLSLVFVCASVFVHYELNKGTMSNLARAVDFKYARSAFYDREKRWQPVSHNLFDKASLYRYAPQAPAKKDAKQSIPVPSEANSFRPLDKQPAYCEGPAHTKG